jgi:hypothetical protein
MELPPRPDFGPHLKPGKHGSQLQHRFKIKEDRFTTTINTIHAILFQCVVLFGKRI